MYTEDVPTCGSVPDVSSPLLTTLDYNLNVHTKGEKLTKKLSGMTGDGVRDVLLQTRRIPL